LLQLLLLLLLLLLLYSSSHQLAGMSYDLTLDIQPPTVFQSKKTVRKFSLLNKILSYYTMTFMGGTPRPEDPEFEAEGRERGRDCSGGSSKPFIRAMGCH